MVKLSVVIPVKDGGQIFNDALRNLFCSSFKDMEVIVVDDHSTDNSAHIAKIHGCKVFFLKHKYGAAAARNLGAKKAKAETILFMDSDIIVSENSIENIYTFYLKKRVPAIGYYDDPYYTDILSAFFNYYMTYIFHGIEKSDSFFTSFAIINRRLFFKAGGFDESFSSATVEDTDLGQRIGPSAVYTCARIKHAKKVVLRSLIKIFFTRARDSVKILLSGIKKGRYYSDNTVRLNIKLSLLLVFSLPFFFLPYYWHIFPAAYLVLNLNFFYFILKRSLIVGVISVPLFLIVLLSISVGLICGVFEQLR